MPVLSRCRQVRPVLPVPAVRRELQGPGGERRGLGAREEPDERRLEALSAGEGHRQPRSPLQQIRHR